MATLQPTIQFPLTAPNLNAGQNKRRSSLDEKTEKRARKMPQESFSNGTDAIPVPPQSGEWSFTARLVSYPAPPILLAGIEQLERMAFERQAEEDAPPLSSRIISPPSPALPLPFPMAPAASPSVMSPISVSPATLPGLSPASCSSSTPTQPEITERILPNGSIMRRFPDGRIEITGFKSFATLAAAKESEPHREIPICPGRLIARDPRFDSPAFTAYREQAALIQSPPSPPVDNSDDVESSDSDDSSETDTKIDPSAVSNLNLTNTEIEET